MKSFNLYLALSLLLGSPIFAENEIDFTGKVGFVNEYIWRGIERSDQTNFYAKLKWEAGNWHGKFKGTYDNASDNYITDFDSNWLEFQTHLGYKLQEDDDGSWDAGYIYYSYYDDYQDSQEIYVKYSGKSEWNPTFAAYYDFDFNKGAYLNAGISKTIKDREWDYRFGLNLGYFSSYGERYSDQKFVGGTLFQNPGNNSASLSGVADLVPSITLTRHVDEQSSFSLSLAGTILTNDGTYNSLGKDHFVWGLGYEVDF